MPSSMKIGQWCPLLWLSLAVVTLAGDYAFGPFVSFPILYLFPVALASRYEGRSWGIGLAITMPLIHFGFTFLWPAPGTVTDATLNGGIRVAVLVVFAVLIDKTTRQAREIRTLQGLLPVCAFCKRIRTENQEWQQIEAYISDHSEARFSHTFCPDCCRKHYPELDYPAPSQRQATDPDALPG
jgi:hypothetical protein